MGMDIYGMDAKNKAGSYFRRNCIAWYPLADYIIDRCPKEITAKCQYWHSNDRDGLDEEDAIKLADFIDEQIEKYPNDGYKLRKRTRMKPLIDPNID
jgi:hypothetical protein